MIPSKLKNDFPKCLIAYEYSLESQDAVAISYLDNPRDSFLAAELESW